MSSLIHVFSCSCLLLLMMAFVLSEILRMLNVGVLLGMVVLIYRWFYTQQELKAHEKRSIEKLEGLKKRENHLQWKLEELK